MTREEAIENLKELLECSYVDRFEDSENEALDMAIKALDQEPCDDAISRQAYIERFRKWGYSEYGRRIDNEALAIRVAMSLPPVNPQPKTGHWRAIYQGDEIIDYRCSECEFGNTFGKSTYRMNYCPNCGARMESET